MLATDLLMRNVRLRPNAMALRYQDTTCTFAELNHRANRYAHALREVGVERGHRVAVLAKNCADYIALYFANGKIGGVTTPLNYRLMPAELQYIINDAQATTLLFEYEYAETVAAMASELDTVQTYICMDGAPDAHGDVRPLAGPDLLAQAPDAEPDAEIGEHDLIWQMYTSGTTGHPKGAMITHRNLIANVVSGIVELPIAPGDTYLIPTPLYHAAATITFATAYARGAGIVLKRDFLPSDILATIPDERITHALLIPAMIIFLLNTPGVEKVDYSSLRYIVYGASPIPVDVLKRALSVFGCKFYQAYGQTEAVALLTHLGPEDHDPDGPNAHRLASAGQENFGVTIRVVNDDGNDVGPNEIGEVIACGDNIMQGYWHLEEATAEALKADARNNKWLYTGDLATMDEDRYVYIVDRKKDMIISGGENIYPREIEEVLYTHPSVADAAVIGIPHDTWGEAVHAVIVNKPDAAVTEGEIMEFCREHVGSYKCPRTVAFVDALPRNLSGKVLKKELRAPYWDGKQRSVN